MTRTERNQEAAEMAHTPAYPQAREYAAGGGAYCDHDDLKVEVRDVLVFERGEHGMGSRFESLDEALDRCVAAELTGPDQEAP